MGQEDAAQKIFRDDVGVQLNESISEFVGTASESLYINENEKILSKFEAFCKLYDGCKPWGNGSNFDLTILESLFDDYRISIPWNFRNIRDLRTFKEYVYDGSQTERVGTYHNALDDAIYQAQVVIDVVIVTGKLPRYRNPIVIKQTF